MNILEKANEIITSRSEENFTADDIFATLIALKFSRHSYNYKEDNFLDAAAYLGAWNDYIQEKSSNENK